MTSTDAERLMPPPGLIAVQEAAIVLGEYEFEDEAVALRSIETIAYGKKHPMEYTEDLHIARQLVYLPGTTERLRVFSGEVSQLFQRGHAQLLHEHNRRLTEVEQEANDFLTRYPRSLVGYIGFGLTSISSVSILPPDTFHLYSRLGANNNEGPITMVEGQLWCDLKVISEDADRILASEHQAHDTPTV